MSKDETASVRVFRIYPDVSAEAGDDELADGQSETRSLRFFVDAFKAFEYLALLFRWNAAAGVGHGKLCHAPFVLFQAQDDAAFFGKFGCIHQYIDEYLMQPHGVGLYLQCGEGRLEGDFRLCLLDAFQRLDDALAEGDCVAGGEVELNVCQVQAGDVYHVVY